MSCKHSGSDTSTKSKDGLFATLCGKNKGKKDCSNSGSGTCPPIPCFDTRDCKPAWLCSPPPITTKTYPAPEGVEIVPISKGGRFGTQSDAKKGGGKCSACGRADECDKKSAKPKGPNVKNKECPMMKPRCPGKEPEKKESGFFAKLTSLFGGGKEAGDESADPDPPCNCGCCDEDEEEEKEPSETMKKVEEMCNEVEDFCRNCASQVGAAIDKCRDELRKAATPKEEDCRPDPCCGVCHAGGPDLSKMSCERRMKKLKYKGGMSLDECQDWLWIKNKDPARMNVPEVATWRKQS